MIADLGGDDGMPASIRAAIAKTDGDSRSRGAAALYPARMADCTCLSLVESCQLQIARLRTCELSLIEN
jgi:hypothetical protein